MLGWILATASSVITYCVIMGIAFYHFGCPYCRSGSGHRRVSTLRDGYCIYCGAFWVGSVSDPAGPKSGKSDPLFDEYVDSL
jgi:hypothetical protein